MTSFKHELVGAVGMPIAENPTGIMQEAAFQACGLQWRYLLFEGGEADLPGIVAGMRAMRFKGANFTIPHKVAILAHLDDISASASLIGAVNTVRVGEDGAWIGENTDGQGFMQALAEAGVDVAGKRITVLGAGGASRAICVELALAGAGAITIVNRSAARAEPLVAIVNDKTDSRAEFVPWQGTIAIDPSTDILVNATSIGLFPSTEKPDIDDDTISADMLVCDVIPNPPDTPFLQMARGRGARTLDGLGMLVWQGAIAFRMWTGQDAPREAMHQALADLFG